MPNNPDIAAVAGALADPTRARMLAALMDGRARTATELALEGGVTPSTTSSHLARLRDAGLVSLTSQGRHRYYRLAGTEVASAVEGLMTVAPRARRAPLPGPADQRLRHARVCYDHLAGEAGVALFERMRARRFVSGNDEELALTPAGEAWCRRIGLDLAELRSRRRRLCRACLDWSERRTHLAGALGAALLDRLFALRYASRERNGRRVLLSPRGEAFVKGLELAR
ncbi:MAG TPA: winged helix-turn-helix domain-containing protein [Gemmatimonadales bacterium]|nr:winged helix-turn-helix domain-containing protein [Gemmatimonadales bacterium]